VPQEPGHVFYVWMDALANYITALGFGEEGAGRKDYEKYWRGADERMHFVGKEIIRFHCLYWPAMLRAAELPTPTRVFAHGWLTKNGKKLSKTTGNTIDPDELISRCGADAFRYFFLREGSFGQDWDFTDAAFGGRYNADLANDLGNLVSRALTMVARYRAGRVPSKPAAPPASATDFEALFQLDAVRAPQVQKVLSSYEDLDFAGALAEVWGWIGRLNQRIVEVSPWQLAKDATRADELDAFLYRLLEAIRLVAVLVEPVMPGAARRILAMLGLARHDLRPADLDWGLLEAGSPLEEIAPLFPRLEAGAARLPDAVKITGHSSTTEKEKTVSEIDIADFGRVDLRVAQIQSAERVAGSKKLIKLQVDVGGATRQVVAGIAEAYAPEALVGKKIILVANLKPARLMGVESDGMVLAASLDGKAVLCTFDGDVLPGTKIK
jgi:methionyl-tRNA synthetase